MAAAPNYSYGGMRDPDYASIFSLLLLACRGPVDRGCHSLSSGPLFPSPACEGGLVRPIIILGSTPEELLALVLAHPGGYRTQLASVSKVSS